VRLAPLIYFVKQIGIKLRDEMIQNKGKLQIFYEVYILSAGLMDDIQEVLDLLGPEWKQLPI